MKTGRPVNNHDQQMCKQCKGLCCQGHPGVWVNPVRFFRLYFSVPPREFENLATRLQELSLVLHDYDGVPVPAPRGGENGCEFLRPTGCQLAPECRPCQCLALEPRLETLIEGEVRCRLPAGFGYGQVRAEWNRYWQALNSSREPCALAKSLTSPENPA